MFKNMTNNQSIALTVLFAAGMIIYISTIIMQEELSSNKIPDPVEFTGTK